MLTTRLAVREFKFGEFICRAYRVHICLRVGLMSTLLSQKSYWQLLMLGGGRVIFFNGGTTDDFPMLK